MANLQNIRRRIKSVKNIQKITNAMDMIARSRFNAARDALIANIPYVEKTRAIIRRVMTQMHGREDESPYIMTREEFKERYRLQGEKGNAAGKFLYIVIASDKGLAGAYSSNVFKEAHETIEYDGSEESSTAPVEEENFHKKNFDAIKELRAAGAPRRKQLKATAGYATAHSGQMSSFGGGSSGDTTANLSVAKTFNDADYVDDVDIIAVGRKAASHFRSRGYNVVKEYSGISERPKYYVAKEIADYIVERFQSGEIIEVTMIYTKFKSAISCVPDDVTLLPIITDDYENLNLKDDYIYEPDVVSVLNNFLPRRLATRIYGAMLHSAASELSSRMNAMSNATDNAQELIGKLNLYYNKVRQAGITSEINEIVGGAEALK